MQKRDSLDILEGQHAEEEDSKEKIKEPCTAFDKEQKSKSENEKAPSWLSSNPPCVQENNQQKEKYLKVMKEEDIQDDPNQQMD